MSTNTLDQFLANASRTTSALRPNQATLVLPHTFWGKFLANASRTTSALAPTGAFIKNVPTALQQDVTSRMKEEREAAYLDVKRAKWERLISIAALLSLINFALILVTILSTLRMDQSNANQKIAELFSDPGRLGIYGTIAVVVSTVMLGVMTGVMASSITKAAYSRPKLTEDGIRLKQSNFSRYVADQLKIFDNSAQNNSRVVHRLYTNRKGIVYELSRKDGRVLIIERVASDGDVLSIGKGKISDGDLKITFKVIDGSETRAELKFTDKDEKQLEGTFNNVTYNELINGSMVCLA